MRRWIWVLLVLALAGGAAWWAFGTSAASKTSERPQTITVKRGTLRQSVLAAGVIESASLVSVGAQVGGQVQSLPVKLGDVLKAGDLVAQLDPEEQQTALLRAEAALAQIEAQIVSQEATIAEARQSLERKRQLTEKRLTTTQDLEAAETQLKVAEANLKALEASRAQAELSVQSSRIALERTRITAPSDGTVVAVTVREGQTLNANQSSPTVIKLARLDTMVVKAEISEADVINVKPGLPATFTLPGAPDMRFRATLRAVEPAPASIATSDDVDTSKAIYFNALLDVPNPDGVLRIGMTAEVSILLDSAEDVLMVPTAALSSNAAGERVVKVVAPGATEPSERVVEVGLTTAAQAAILSGLSEGDEVVSSGRPARGGAGGGGPAGGAGPRGPRGPISMF